MITRKRKLQATVALLLFSGVAAAQFFGFPSRILNLIVTNMLTVEGPTSLEDVVTITDDFTPNLIIIEPGATTDEGVWGFRATGDQFQLRTMEDDTSPGALVYTVDRTGTTVDEIDFLATSVLHNGSPIGGSGGPTLVYKTTTENVTSSSTLQDDDELCFTASASTTYVVDYVLYPFSTSGTPDFEFNFNTPSVITSYYSGNRIDATSILINTDVGVVGTSQIVHTLNANQNTQVFGSATIRIDTTGGSVCLEWAQNISDAVATSLRLGSWLRYEAI